MFKPLQDANSLSDLAPKRRVLHIARIHVLVNDRFHRRCRVGAKFGDQIRRNQKFISDQHLLRMARTWASSFDFAQLDYRRWPSVGLGLRQGVPHHGFMRDQSGFTFGQEITSLDQVVGCRPDLSGIGATVG